MHDQQLVDHLKKNVRLAREGIDRAMDAARLAHQAAEELSRQDLGEDLHKVVQHLDSAGKYLKAPESAA